MKTNKTNKTKKVYGEYDKFGYRIYLNDEQVYGAGNSPYDSTVIIPVEDENSDALSLKSIRKYCIKTGKEIAQEHNAKWIDATYNPA
jgi:hypothetical protein